MAELTHSQYDLLERAIAEQRRIVVYRRGTEYIVIPARLRVDGRREAVEATHPNTGDKITFYVDELDSIEVVR